MGVSTFQKRVGAPILVVSFTRDNSIRNINIENRDHDYLLARDILNDMDNINDNPHDVRFERSRYIKLRGESTSPCATAAWFDVRKRGTQYHFRVHRVAGHGAWASHLTEEDINKLVG